MTYCLAIKVDAGLILCSDSRTNAGIDQVSSYSKMYHFGIDDTRQLVIMSSGNLATTQAVISRLRKDMKDDAQPNLRNLETLDEVADYIGGISVSVQEKHAHHNSNISFEASFILGGQIGDEPPGIMLIYPQGNHIAHSELMPYLQIGESKYGKPILDRILKGDTTLDTAALCALVSMDSTMRSNLSVGPPIELMIYASDSFQMYRSTFDADNAYLRELNKSWDNLIIDAFLQLPPLGLEHQHPQ